MALARRLQIADDLSDHQRNELWKYPKDPLITAVSQLLAAPLVPGLGAGLLSTPKAKAHTSSPRPWCIWAH